MGLFQILSRKSGKAKSRDHAVQQQHEGSQSTDSGADNLLKSPPQGLNQEAQFSKLSLGLSDDSDLAAPPPFMPAFSSPFTSPQRPGSSRSTRSNHSFNSVFGQFGQQRTPQNRPKREARKPPVSFRKPASLASISNGFQPSLYGADDGSDAGSIYATRQRTNSLKSTTSGRSRDLLDVLEEIRPVEFRTRVMAGGARDYGEDVADRNIRQSRATISTPNLKSHFDTDRGSSSLSWRTGTGSSMRSRTRSPSSFTSSRLATGYTPGEYFENAQREASAASKLLEPGSFSRRNKNRLSLNTYVPSGLDPPQTPRSVVTTPGYREGIAARDFGSIGSLASEPESMSRQYHLSPTASNFSVPRSPMPPHEPLPKQADIRSEIAARAMESTSDQNSSDVFTANGTGYQWRTGASARNNSLPRTSVRFSNQTYRSSLASSMTSRNGSIDFTPLGHPPSCPRLRSNSTDLKHPDEGENAMRRRPLSMHSHRLSKSDSSEDGSRHSRTRSLVGAPSVLRNLLEEDEMGMSARFSGNRDWALETPSNGSTASSSNLYSSSSGRPVSRHTKATSVDSTSHAPSSSRKSEDSFMSGPYHGQQSGATWSPATTRSTGFNIDDYISSDDESFTTEKRRQRPTADGEEDLLFKNGFNGALPGLLEPMDDICPAPVVRLTRGQSRERPATAHAPTTWKSEAERASAAAARRTMDDDQISLDLDRPAKLLRQVRSGPEDGNLGTFGRRTKKPVRDHAVTSTPSSGAEEWATPSEIMCENNNNRTTSPPRGYFNQKRLSALGTLHGRGADLGLPAASAAAAGGREPAPATIPEAAEKIDHAAAIRLRKEAKARKRAEEARSAREKRMTRAFGDLEEDIAAMLMAQGEAAELGRGRQLMRGRSPQDKGKGKAAAF